MIFMLNLKYALKVLTSLGETTLKRIFGFLTARLSLKVVLMGNQLRHVYLWKDISIDIHICISVG